MSIDLRKLQAAALAKAQTFFITAADEVTLPMPVSRAQANRGFGWRMLPRFKVVNGYRFQLHATRGWKCLGRVS